MQNFVLAVSKRVWPALGRQSTLERVVGAGNVFAVLYSTPLVMVGTVWLVAQTDFEVVWREWALIGAMMVVIYLLLRWNFFFTTEIKRGIFADLDGTLNDIVELSAVLLMGPTLLWMNVFWIGFSLLQNVRQFKNPNLRWVHLRDTVMGFASNITIALVSLWVYEVLGGDYPMGQLAWEAVLPALGMILVMMALTTLLYTPLMLYWASSSVLGGTADARVAFVNFFITSMGWRIVVFPFAILAAGVYAYSGWVGYFFLMAGVLLSSGVAHHMSIAVERNRRRSTELERLERLSRAILNSKPDVASLYKVLREHVPGMFTYSHIEIRLFPNELLLAYPETSPPMPSEAWQWIRKTTVSHYFMPDRVVPWNVGVIHHALIATPVLDTETNEVLGGIFLQISKTILRRGADSIENIIPAVQSLAGQIASALNRVKEHARALATQRMSQELMLAGQIQNAFLPQNVPEIQGWQLAAMLEPARQTSGDFYDLIPLPDGKLGIVVADVADKGMGAALFMALSRTLIRVYAGEFPFQPNLTLEAANRRIMTDTHSDMFVTVFFGILDPVTNRFVYCNAGHNPAFFVSDGRVEPMKRTGIPLGLFEKSTWKCEAVTFAPGDMLVMYTDGLIEAVNRQGEMFEEQRLIDLIRAQHTRSARAVHSAIIRTAYQFMEDVPLADDLTLIVVAKE